ncbi:YbaB/EbfC family nucleoid-associated protein [Nocardia sp. NPDC006630]|uniref:YbaB/EbfC family nucleoid-associated protein n=1 Tax=Nocardia sp. NPDC006630 TaxID=3157181 RepID=UPI0033B3DA9C
MANEAEKARLAELKELVQGSFASIARAQQDRSRLTATAHAGGRRITITVNADGVVIKTEFSGDIEDLTYSEIAAAVTAATQDAARQVQQQAQQIITAAQQKQAQVPPVSELFPMMPDIQSMIPTPPEASLTPPGSPDRKAVEPDPAVQFTDIEEFEHDPTIRERSSIAAPEW